jgi:hypothetical protein
MLLNIYPMNTTQKKPTLKKMKKTILLCSLFMAMSFTIHAQQPSYDLATLFYGEEINNTVNDIHQMTPEDEQVAVLQKLTTEKQSILLSIAAVYENDFSATEIQTILSFYTSPLGQRWLALKDPLKESSNDIFTEWLTTLQDRL